MSAFYSMLKDQNKIQKSYIVGHTLLGRNNLYSGINFIINYKKNIF